MPASCGPARTRPVMWSTTWRAISRPASCGGWTGRDNRRRGWVCRGISWMRGSLPTVRASPWRWTTPPASRTSASSRSPAARFRGSRGVRTTRTPRYGQPMASRSRSTTVIPAPRISTCRLPRAPRPGGWCGPHSRWMPASPTRSSDARYLLFDGHPRQGGGATQVWIADLVADSVRVLLADDFAQQDARLSPDGRWIAYVSRESGREELYVRSFPDRRRRWLVSTGGAADPALAPRRP